MTLTEAEAVAIVKEDYAWIDKNVGNDVLAEDFMIEAIKQARLHLDNTFEDKFKWGGAPKPANYNEYRKHRSFKEHASKIWNTLRVKASDVLVEWDIVQEYITNGDIAAEKKQMLQQIHLQKGVKTVQFHYMMNGILVALIVHGRYKGARKHTDGVLGADFAKNEQAWRIAYDKVKYGLQF